MGKLDTLGVEYLPLLLEALGWPSQLDVVRVYF